MAITFSIAAKRGERKKSRVVPEAARELRLLDRLRGAAGEARDHDRSFARPARGGAHREFQHRLEQSCLANGELGGVHADREPARAGIEIIAGEGALTPGIELAVAVERERMRGNHYALAQRREHLRGPFVPARHHELCARIALQMTTTL